MAQQKETKPEKRRTQVKELPKQKKELSAESMKKVKGGSTLEAGILSYGKKN